MINWLSNMLSVCLFSCFRRNCESKKDLIYKEAWSWSWSFPFDQFLFALCITVLLSMKTLNVAAPLSTWAVSHKFDVCLVIFTATPPFPGTLPPLWLCCLRNIGAAGRRRRWPGRRGSDAAACRWPPAARGHAKQTPWGETKRKLSKT